ncbi:MAG TPA: glycosyltransferase [Bosea sp. (in: a-proteobacteria)]|uniref:glycosyltransferase family 2 protein n=1 Tax=Bosea sp. (in: a-proteobacteria) TaxID=1871050 RepID=UPI002E0FCAF4|nr:glycosyltransferase [Bosea sp. (in: a-proteobacteria)]
MSVEAVICIPTFRRPEWLRRTLQSVIGQKADFGFAIVVVDNDGRNPLGAALANEILSATAVPHAVVVEHEQGNCHAINRAFGTALDTYPAAQHILMIDDDEIALDGWLQAMVNLSRARDADLVGGPVLRQFETRPGATVMQHPLFVSIDGETRQVDQLHGSGNCLIRRRVFEKLPRPPFDVRFNFLGGGDMEFFTRCRLAGFKTWWCAEAIAHEFVAPERTTASFLAKRSVRTGSINYMIDRLHQPLPFALLKNAASLLLGVLRGLRVLVATGSPLLASHPFLMPIGRIVASVGLLPKPYRSSS